MDGLKTGITRVERWVLTVATRFCLSAIGALLVTQCALKTNRHATQGARSVNSVEKAAAAVLMAAFSHLH